MITKKEVQHIAKLARLGLTEKEIEKMRKELSSILGYIEKLKEVDISGVEPTYHPVLVENIMRNDEEIKERGVKILKLIKLAPKTKNGYLKVKKII